MATIRCKDVLENISRPSEPVVWTEQKIISQLCAGKINTCFPKTRWLCVPNVSWGMLDYEADLLALSERGWLREIEVKISVSDLKADQKKAKHKKWESPRNPVSELYYAMPNDVWEKVKDAPPIPDHAGVIVVGISGGHNYIRHASRHEYSRTLFLEERVQLARLGVIRYWSRIERNPNNDT